MLKNRIKKTWLCALLAAFSTAGFAAGTTEASSQSEGEDFATVVLHDPWDMANQADIFPLLWTHNLGSASLSNGVMTGVARDSDPHFWLHFPQIPSSILPLNHRHQLIDASRYDRLAFYMWLPEDTVPGSKQGRLVWHHGGASVTAFDAAYSESTLFAVYPGWHLYHFDLASQAITRGSAWSGTIHGLRIDPCLACAVTFKIDWARLYASQSQTGRYALPAGKSRLLVDTDSNAANGILGVFKADGSGQVPLGGLPPGSYAVAALSDADYALAERGNPWDMDSTSDFAWSSTSGFSSASVANNQFSGRTNSADPYLLLDVPPDHPIDASKYRYLAIDMSLDAVPAQESGLLVWWGAQTATPQYPTAFISVSAGRKTYAIDLGSSSNWKGWVKALRIDPLNGPQAGSGVNVTLHGVRLTSQQGLTESVAYQATPLKINATPRIKLVSPAYDSGEDYASAELGAPWNMAGSGVEAPSLSNLNGWEYVNSIPDLGVSGSFFHASSRPASAGQTEGDPHAFLSYQQNSKPIAADTYRYLGFQLYVPFDASQQNELTTGAVARIAWKSGDADAGVTSDDIVLLPGLQTYWFDMKTLGYEPASTRTWSGSVPYLRIDPFEFSSTRHFYLGPVRLTAAPAGRYVLPISVDLEDADNDLLSLEVRAGTTVLSRTTDLSPGRVQLLVSLGALAEGSHTLTLVVSDGKNTHETALPVPVRKLSVATPVTAYEQSRLDRVFNWAEALLPQTLTPHVASSSQHACVVPGAWARRYAGGSSCLMGLDGVVVYTLGGNELRYAGTLDDLFLAALAAGF